MALTKEDKMLIKRFKQEDKDQAAVRKKYKDTGTSSNKQRWKEQLSISEKSMEDTTNIIEQGKNAPKGKTFGAKHKSGSQFNARTKHKDWRKTGMFNVSRPSQTNK